MADFVSASFEANPLKIDAQSLSRDDILVAVVRRGGSFGLPLAVCLG